MSISVDRCQQRPKTEDFFPLSNTLQYYVQSVLGLSFMLREGEEKGEGKKKNAASESILQKTLWVFANGGFIGRGVIKQCWSLSLPHAVLLCLILS